MLTIQRQFSLPNCVLILEGFNIDGSSSPRPLLSTLTRFECHFGNESQRIEGGRELLDILAQKVHGQAQSLLSGIHSKAESKASHDDRLTLETSGQGRYTLAIDASLIENKEDDSVAPNSSQGEKNANSIQLQLNSVQLFDLVEAFDQLMADSQTLPDLNLKLRPLSRKEAIAEGGAGEKVLPLGLGVASLALIAAVSFVLPAPEITKPKPPEGETTNEAVESAPNSTTPPATPPATQPESP